MNPVILALTYLIRGIRLVGFVLLGAIYVPVFAVKLLVDLVSPKELPNNQTPQQA